MFGIFNEFVGFIKFGMFNWCSYVLASYARFLWDAEEEEDEDNEEVEAGVDSFGKPSSPPFVFGVQPQLLPLAAAS